MFVIPKIYYVVPKGTGNRRHRSRVRVVDTRENEYFVIVCRVRRKSSDEKSLIVLYGTPDLILLYFFFTSITFGRFTCFCGTAKGAFARHLRLFWSKRSDRFWKSRLDAKSLTSKPAFGRRLTHCCKQSENTGFPETLDVFRAFRTLVSGVPKTR